MAELGGVSARTLCNAFVRFRGCTAKQFLQSVRLTRVRKELVDAQASVSVTTVARKWGFKHTGRLAGVYRKVFGEAPSDTLRRPGAFT
jgi:transcriptional regulator GlxA family with amidase domain